MKVRGTRECQDCGTRWSYYETGSVDCPECGSLRSVGVEDERRLHTAGTVSLDLSPARDAVDGEPIRRVAERAAEAARPFTRSYGFVDGGALQPLDDTYLAAMELRTVADDLRRRARVDDDEEYYLLELLRGADRGERPDLSAVPDSLRDARGLAYANAVKAYRSDLRAYLEEHPDPNVDAPMETLGEHVTRVRALDGDVAPETAERLVAAARDLGTYLLEGDETALATATDRLSRLG